MKHFILVLASAMLLLLASCGTKFAITSSGETLLKLTKVTDLEEPCLNPFGGDDGHDLYFSVREEKKYYNIYKKENPFSNAISQKTSGKNFNFSPAYCEANGKIAFRCQLEGASTSDIYMMNNNQGKAMTQITESSNAWEDNPCFSKDGKYLVYDKLINTYYKSKNFMGIQNVVVIQNTEVWLRNLETGETMLLGNGSQPSFSPDGKTIVFVKYSSDAKSCSIWTMDTEGGNQNRLTDAKKGFAFHPRFSPDGKFIVFECQKKDKKDFDIYTIDVNGNDLNQITQNKSYDGQPYWATDGYIYFVSDRGGKKGNYQIWRFKM